MGKSEGGNQDSLLEVLNILNLREEIMRVAGYISGAQGNGMV